MLPGVRRRSARKDPAMDGSRFDLLTRSLAASRSRRGLLGGLVALAAGGAGARAAGAQAQCGNVSCRNNPGKCNPGCVCCVWGNGNSRCMAPGSCTGTPTCPPGQILGPAGNCVVPTTTITTTTTAVPDRTCPAGAAGLCAGASRYVFCSETPRCNCDVTSTGTSVCRSSLEGVCRDCAVDADCEAATGVGSFCFPGPECCLSGTFCAPPCPLMD